MFTISFNGIGGDKIAFTFKLRMTGTRVLTIKTSNMDQNIATLPAGARNIFLLLLNPFGEPLNACF